MISSQWASSQASQVAGRLPPARAQYQTVCNGLHHRRGYTSSLTLDLYELADGQTASCSIVKIHETTGLVLSAVRTGNTITLKLNGTQVNTIHLHGCRAIHAENAVIENGSLIPAAGADTIVCTVE